MKVFSRSEGESLIIGDDVTVTVVEVGHDYVRLRIEAPHDDIALERESFEVTVPAGVEKRLPR